MDMRGQTFCKKRIVLYQDAEKAASAEKVEVQAKVEAKIRTSDLRSTSASACIAVAILRPIPLTIYDALAIEFSPWKNSVFASFQAS
jgi:hypothetical protein